MFRSALMLSILSLTLSPNAVLGAPALPNCRWTAEMTEMIFKKDDVFMESPKIENSSCQPNLSPICSGYAYCPKEKPERHGIAVACKSIKGEDDQWHCPDAQTCFDDRDISVSPNNKTPGQAAGASAPPAAVEATE